jgi:transposase InsO family protein
LVLVVLSVVEQRLDAVRLVLAGVPLVEVAQRVGVHRSTLHRWVGRYLTGQVPGLADRSHRPRFQPAQVPEAVEVAVAEVRRAHPRWGSRRIRLELLRGPLPWADPLVMVPSERTIDRVLARQGLVRARRRPRPRDSYVRFERPGPMQLWQMDIVGGVELVDPATGKVREAKVVTGIDDHSRFCVCAAVVERATSRAVCLAFAQALARFGVPEEVLTDNGKQFTDRFGGRGEVLFDKICRKNGVAHRLTAPYSPNQNGKVERFHGTFRPEFLDESGPFTSLAQAQEAVDVWVADYNQQRPHQGLDTRVPVTPSDRFAPVGQAERTVLDLWVPPSLTVSVIDGTDDVVTEAGDGVQVSAPVSADGPVEFNRVVPASGNMMVVRRQMWVGPKYAGMTARFWADCRQIHVLIAGTRIKTVRSHLSVNDVAVLVAAGAVPAGPDPLPPIADGDPVEVERCVSAVGHVGLAGAQITAAESLAGQRVGVRIEPATLMFYDLDTRVLLRTRPNPLTPEQVKGLRGMRPAGPPLQPRTEPIRVQRRASDTGVIVVAGQKVALGRIHRGQMVTAHVSETTLRVEFPDGDTRVIARTTDQAVRSIKGQRPRTATK